MKKQGSGVSGQGSEKTQNPPIITVQTVTDALEKLGGAGAAAVADHLQAQTYKERSLVRKVLSSLLQAGGVKAVRQQGVVVYHLNDKPGARGGVQAKLWEFACLRFATAKPFTAVEAARLAECDRDYTKRYCRWLWESGYLQIVTRGRAGAWLYQVVGGREHELAPHWNRRAEKRKSSGQGSVASGQKEEQKPSPQERLDAALKEFSQALVEISGGVNRAWEIIREMKDTILAVEEQDHGKPGEPTEGHH